MRALLFFLRDALVAKRLEFPDDCEIRVRRGSTPDVVCTGDGDRFEVIVGSRTISEDHCIIRIERGEVCVSDLGSRNGTLLRATPNVAVALEGRALQLGSDLVVREADARWQLPDAVLSAGPAGLCAWMNEHLARSGLRVFLSSPEHGSLPVADSAEHVVARAIHGEGTLDAQDAVWARWAVGRYNANQNARSHGPAWRFVAASEGRRRALDQARCVAASSLPVLLVGPTGVGKDVLAQDIHDHGVQRGGPFVAVNCALLDAERLESALFGHVRGAFTGAHADAVGLVEAAHNGTLFLDELAEMPIALQASLLRFLESERGEYRRMGEVRVRSARVRVIAATNRDPEDATRVRTDLYYRVAGVRIDVPALDGADAAAIATELLRAAGSRAHLAVSDHDVARIAASAAVTPWPGGARELRLRIERTVQLRRNDESLWTSWSASARGGAEMTREPAKIPAMTATRIQPATFARLTSELAFLLAARDVRDRAALAARTQMTWQGADQRLAALGVTVGDVAAIDARLATTRDELRALLRDAPALAASLRSLTEG